MKIVLAMFDDRISPRFDVAPRMSVYRIEGDKITHNKDIFCEEWTEMERVYKLKDLQVDILVCGAITSNSCEILRNNGTSVIPWVIGVAEKFLKTFSKDQTKSMMVQARKNLLLKNSKDKRKHNRDSIKVGSESGGMDSQKKHAKKSTMKVSRKEGGA